jgi:hypothetical protein
MGDQRVRIEVPPPVSQSRRLAVSPSRQRPRRSYASRPAPIALSRGRETVRGLRGRAANHISRQRSQSPRSTVEDPALPCETPARLIIPIDLKPLKATMPTTTPTIWDRISEEKTKVSERLARLDTDRATVATQLTDLETAEGVLMRVSKTPPARRPASAAAAEAKAATATRGRGRPPKAATSKSAGREPNAPSLGERLLALATGKTRQELYVACPNDRPNHIGIAVQRHLRADFTHL